MRALFIALPIFLVLSGCGEEIQAQDPSPTQSDKMTAMEGTEMPSADGEAETPEIELRDPVGLD